MRYLILLPILLLTACKDSGSSATLSTTPGVQCAPQMDVGSIFDPGVGYADYNGQGYYIDTEGDYDWVKTYTDNYFYRFNPNTNEIGGANVGLIYNDDSCTDLIGEVFNYSIHSGSDTYIFEFENNLYEYSIVPGQDFFGSINQVYYFKTPGGSCNRCDGQVDNVREVTPSAYSL